MTEISYSIILVYKLKQTKINQPLKIKKMTKNSERYSDYLIEPVAPEVYHHCKWCGSNFNSFGDLVQDFEMSDNSEIVQMSEPCEACEAFMNAEKLANLTCIYRFALKNKFDVEKTVADCKKDNLYFHVDRIAEIIELLKPINKLTL